MGVLSIVWNGAGGEGLLRGARRSWLGETERGRQAMDFRMRQFSKLAKFPRAEHGLRPMVERAPQAEALATSCIDRALPLGTGAYALLRPIPTLAFPALQCFTFGPVIFYTNAIYL